MTSGSIDLENNSLFAVLIVIIADLIGLNRLDITGTRQFHIITSNHMSA